LPEGVPAAGITPTEPGSFSPPGELDVGVALPLLSRPSNYITDPDTTRTRLIPECSSIVLLQYLT
jgi:hypothetical protein